jgi:hypothetical protein
MYSVKQKTPVLGLMSVQELDQRREVGFRKAHGRLTRNNRWADLCRLRSRGLVGPHGSN